MSRYYEKCARCKTQMSSSDYWDQTRWELYESSKNRGVHAWLCWVERDGDGEVVCGKDGHERWWYAQCRACETFYAGVATMNLADEPAKKKRRACWMDSADARGEPASSCQAPPEPWTPASAQERGPWQRKRIRVDET